MGEFLKIQATLFSQTLFIFGAKQVTQLTSGPIRIKAGKLLIIFTDAEPVLDIKQVGKPDYYFKYKPLNSSEQELMN